MGENMNNELVAWIVCLGCGQKVTGDSIHTCSPQLKTLTDDPLVNFKPVWQEKPELTLTDEKIWAVANDYFVGKNDLVYGFARAILRKAQEK